MVSPKVAITIAMTSVPLFLFFESEGASSSSGSLLVDDGVEIAAFASQKVNLSVYNESLCLSCAAFIVKNLGDIFNRDLINIVNLKLLPWANAHISNTNNSILCQNGPDECELNSLEACVLDVWTDVNKHYALIYCIEFLAIEGRHKMWQNCFSQLGLPEEPILNCYNRGNGAELGRKYITETAHLYPLHTFLPWVVVNDQPIGNDYANFKNYVCKAYNGLSVPAACK